MVILRVQSSLGTARFNFESVEKSTLGDLKKQIKDKWKISEGNQILSYKPFSDPQFLEDSAKASLRDLGLKHGSMLYVQLSENERKVAVKEVGTNKLLVSSAKPKTMRLNELKEQEPEEKPPKYRPYHEFIEERQRLYKDKPFLIDPPTYSYTPKKMGNVAAKKDMPENANLRPQKFRLVDLVTFMDAQAPLKFIREWNKNPQQQRACFLIGEYKKVKNKLKTGKRANDPKWPDMVLQAEVHTIYEPNQVHQPKGAVFSKDAILPKVEEVAKALGMQLVGWMITTKKRDPGELLTGQEFMQAAMFQNKFQNFAQTSRFVTLVTDGQDTKGYMISEQGCALQKSGIVGRAHMNKKDPTWAWKIRVKTAEKGVYYPSVVSENREVKQGCEFDPSFMLTTAEVTMTVDKTPIFKTLTFPHPREARKDIVKAHLTRHRSKPYHSALSDFYLLLYLANIADKNLILQTCEYVRKNKPVNKDLQNKLDAQFSTM